MIYTHLALNAAPSWAAVNPYSSMGWTNYIDPPPGFADIYGAVGNAPWAISEGPNVVLGPNFPDNPGPSPYSWENYLAAGYNHGAVLMNIYGAFEGAGVPLLPLFRLRRLPHTRSSWLGTR